jgi:DNA invertase Pin-like site-specific DNA recombinase
MIWGYARVSTDAQDLASQVAELKAADCEKIICEKMSGANAERPKLKWLMARLQPGDEVKVTAVDRLARDPTDLLVLARQMKQAGAGLISLAEPVVDTTSDFAEVFLAVMGVPAKLARKRIIQNTARGRAHAKAQGVKFGRKLKLTPHQQREAAARIAAGEPQRAVARSYNVSQSTISRQVPATGNPHA